MMLSNLRMLDFCMILIRTLTEYREASSSIWNYICNIKSE